ncbi:hypothetical protein ACCS64_38605, partial [Rhizobium ruizarguesonis]
TSERRLEDMKCGELLWSDRDSGWELLIPAVVKFFEKACRTSSRGRLFRFRYKPGIQAVKADCPVPPALRI